ncbi:head-tail connector protein [Afipia carboxidovorans]|uniref:head-tail connector protein n=1 Tax=Afipia carboxidovorans TaxID=40137 RepID=UPI0030D5E581
MSAAEVKAQTVVDHADDDVLLARLIEAARSYVEAYCGIRLAKRTLSIRCDSFGDFCRLPEAPAQSADLTIEYIDRAGDEQTLAGTVYELSPCLDGLEAAIVLKPGQTWPAIQPRSRITVEVTVGYNAVPPAIKHAMLIWIADAYAKRGSELQTSWTAFDALLCNFRRGV